MPKQNDGACEMQEAGEIGRMALIAGDQTSGVLEPREETFDFPAAPVSAERAAVLREIHPIRTVRRDEFDAAGGERVVQAVAVIRGVPNQPRGIVGEEARVQRLGDELRFVGRGRGDGNGDRKTSAVCNGHDLGPLAALGFADMPPFFLALAKEPSMKVSLRSSPPRACRSTASALRARRSVPVRIQRWNRRWHV